MEEPLKVLIIEDEPDFYRDCLWGWDKEFIYPSYLKEFENVQYEIISRISSVQPALIILDLVLFPGQRPDESIQILRHILSLIDTIPVLVVSKKYNPATRERVLDLGGIDLIDKGHLLNYKERLDKICMLILIFFKKNNQAFSFLENCKIGITDSVLNTGERIVEQQKYYFYTKGSFKNILSMLLQDSGICPAYFFPNVKDVTLSNEVIEHLIELASEEERLLFSDLKRILRESLKKLYLLDSERSLEVSIPHMPDGFVTVRKASPIEAMLVKLDKMMEKSIALGKPPQDIPGMKEEFLEIYHQYPEILTEEHKNFFRAFL